MTEVVEETAEGKVEELKKKRKRKRKPRAKETKGEVITGHPSEGVENPSIGAQSGSAEAGIQQPTAAMLVRHDQPGIVTDFMGNSFLSRRARPWPDDEIQYVCQKFVWDIAGYHDIGAVTAATETPVGVFATKEFLDQAYAYMVQVCKLSRKPRLAYPTLGVDILRGYYNTYVWAVSTCVTLQSWFSLGQFSEAFQVTGTYLVDYMIQLYRLWADLQAIVVPSFIKLFAIENGLIVRGTKIHTPHVRIWQNYDLPLWGLAATYSSAMCHAEAGLQHMYGTLTTEAQIVAVLLDIRNAVRGLEGNIAGASTITAANCFAIKELHEYISTVEDFAPAYKQGLPPLQTIQGVAVSDDVINDFYCRAISSKSSTGTLTTAFPVPNMAGLGSMMPFKGYGVRGMRDHTCLGTAKFIALFDDKSDGTFYRSGQW
jgi:hypothetical protein